jgi:hypothetical protein
MAELDDIDNEEFDLGSEFEDRIGQRQLTWMDV